jgi:hypothetical protein
MSFKKSTAPNSGPRFVRKEDNYDNDGEKDSILSYSKRNYQPWIIYYIAHAKEKFDMVGDILEHRSEISFEESDDESDSDDDDEEPEAPDEPITIGMDEVLKLALNTVQKLKHTLRREKPSQRKSKQEN